jgi:hypothetical protein
LNLKTFTTGSTPNTVRTSGGKVLSVPEGRLLLPPCDSGLTRRVRAAGDHRVLAEKRNGIIRCLSIAIQCFEHDRQELMSCLEAEVTGKQKP